MNQSAEPEAVRPGAASEGADPGPRELSAYEQTARRLSERIVEAQRPIRVLDSIKWDADVQRAFFAAGCERLPEVDRDYYAGRPLRFDPDAKRQEFESITREIRRELGQFSPLGRIMERMCREYIDVVRLLESRGTLEFAALSQQLYGSSSDAFHAGDPNLADMAAMVSETLAGLDEHFVSGPRERDFSGEEAAGQLAERLGQYFRGADREVRVILDDGIVSDAAAGADYIKIRTDARFSERNIRVLEVHEGWVHLGTTLNGLAQPVCTFLGKGPPSSTLTQEGLAVITEIFCFASYPSRVRRLTNRVHAVEMAEQGADFLDVFRFFGERGYDDLESYNNATRVFRGGTGRPDGGAFTKDLVYSKGLVLVFNFIRLAVRKGLPQRIPLLFCGKTTLEDMRTLADLVEEGIVEPPRFVPPQFRDLAALVAWLSYSNFLSRLDFNRVESDYANLF